MILIVTEVTRALKRCTSNPYAVERSGYLQTKKSNPGSRTKLEWNQYNTQVWRDIELNVSTPHTHTHTAFWKLSDPKSVRITLGPAYDSEAWWGTDLYCTVHHVLSFTQSQLRLQLLLQNRVDCSPHHIFYLAKMWECGIIEAWLEVGKVRRAINSRHLTERKYSPFSHGWTSKCRRRVCALELNYSRLHTKLVTVIAIILQ